MPTNEMFTQFQNGHEVEDGDQVVGLRGSVNTRFDFPGVGVKDADGNYMFQWSTSSPLSVNYPKVINSTAGLSVTYTAGGTDENINISFTPKGTGYLAFDGIRWVTSDGLANQAIITNGSNQLGWATVSSVTIPTVDQTVARFNGTAGALEDSGVTINDSDVMSGITQLNVDNLRVDGNTISSTNAAGSITITPDTTGDVILDGQKWPQAAPLTNNCILTSTSAGQTAWSTAAYPLTPGTSGTLMQSNGTNWVNTTATYPGTSGTTGTLLRSNGTNWVNSTATFSDGYNQYDILYASAANTVIGLTKANSAVLTTTSVGAPVYSSTMGNGQLLIGALGASPQVANLTAGTGIGIVNAGGSITINSTGGGLAISTIAGTSQSAAVNTTYIALNAAQTTVTLPSTFAVGDIVVLIGATANTGGWVVTASAGDTVRVNNSTTSSGGTVTSASVAGQTIEIVCDVADTSWVMKSTSSTTLTTA